MRTPTSTSTECAHARVVSSSLAHFIHTHIWLKFEPCPHFTHNHTHVIHVCGLLALIFSFYFPLFLPSMFLFLFLFLTNKKFMANLYNSAEEGVDTTDVLSFPTGTSQTCCQPSRPRDSRGQSARTKEEICQAATQ